jgi:hypothetical protein
MENVTLFIKELSRFKREREICGLRKVVRGWEKRRKNLKENSSQEGRRKRFFFEKKKQKTFGPAGVGNGAATARV